MQKVGLVQETWAHANFDALEFDIKQGDGNRSTDGGHE